MENHLAGLGLEIIESPGIAISRATLRVYSPSTADDMRIASSDQVAWIEPTVEHFLVNDRSRWTMQSNVTASFPIHDQGLLGGTQKLAVMDSGLDASHCCFGNSRVDSYKAFGGGNLADSCGTAHGTHVSGTAACDESGATFNGLAPQADLVIQDIQNEGTFACAFGSVSPPSDLRTAFSDAYGRGARVHTNSWGGGGNTYGSAAVQIDDFVWNQRDMVILFAAGNSGGGANAGTVSAQPANKNGITVGGTESAPRQDWLYGSSSKGPTQDGRQMPTLTAPATSPATGGASVTSASGGTSCSFKGLSGTSMATPAVAGSAILVREYFESGYWPSGAASAADAFNPSTALVKAILVVGADNMTGTDTHGDRPNNSQGWGRVNLDRGLAFAGDTENLFVVDDRDTATGFTAAGQMETFEFFLPDNSQELRVVLSWSDPPAASGAAQVLLNDLDLSVELNGGFTYLGNAGFSNGSSQPGTGSADRMNNTEAVFIESPQPGNLTIRVSADAIRDLPGGLEQDWALVVVGGASEGACTEPPATDVGNDLVVERTAGGVRLSWAAVASDHYEIFRESQGADLGGPLKVFEDNVQDQDPGADGVQWDNNEVLAPGEVRFYQVGSANGCHESTP
jgi:hypothetical protein